MRSKPKDLKFELYVFAKNEFVNARTFTLSDFDKDKMLDLGELEYQPYYIIANTTDSDYVRLYFYTQTRIPFRHTPDEYLLKFVCTNDYQTQYPTRYMQYIAINIMHVPDPDIVYEDESGDLEMPDTTNSILITSKGQLTSNSEEWLESWFPLRTNEKTSVVDTPHTRIIERQSRVFPAKRLTFTHDMRIIVENQFDHRFNAQLIEPQFQVPGTWLHVVNHDLPTTIEEIKNIPGEICVSDVNDGNFFAHRKEFIALLFKGTVSYLYPCDCWSTTIDTNRGRLRLPGNQTGANRTEGFLDPRYAKFLGFVVGGEKAYKHVQSLYPNVPIHIIRQKPRPIKQVIVGRTWYPEFVEMRRFGIKITPIKNERRNNRLEGYTIEFDRTNPIHRGYIEDLNIAVDEHVESD